MRLAWQEAFVERPEARIGGVEEHQVQVAAVDGNGCGEILQHLRLHADVAAELGLHFLELRVIEGKTETGLAAERQLDDLQPVARAAHHRSEERRVGKECVSTCRSRWAPYN